MQYLPTFLQIWLMFSFSSSVIPKALHHGTEEDEKPKKIESGPLPTITAANIDVRLEQGLLQVVLGRRGPVPLCFPPLDGGAGAVAQLFRLAHAACRQLGSAAATQLQERHMWVEEGLVGARCDGHEEAVAQCDWSGMSLQPCHQVTEVHCGNCGQTFTAREGLIRTPGYPVTFLYHLSCEWRIEAPPESTSAIHLVFDLLSAPPVEQSAFECDNDKPFIELTYGDQGHYSIYRYCNFRDLKNLSVPSNSLKIQYSSGIYDPKIIHIQDKPQGLAISFRAEPIATASSLWWVIVLTVTIIVLIAVSVFCYYCRLTLRKGIRPSEQPCAPNVPRLSEVERAIDFQRCYIQGNHNSKPGLRLRSTGSAKAKLASMMHPVKENLISTFRKLSSQGGTPQSTLPHHDPQLLLHCKANLEERFSPNRHPSETSVFIEQPGFTIYCSESSANDLPLAIDIMPRETAL